MATNRDNLDLRIRALVEGVREVETLAAEVQGLQQYARRDIPDNTGRFRQGMRRTRDQVDGLRRSLNSMRSMIIGVGGALGASKIASEMYRVANSVEQLNNQARYLGVPTQRMQELAFSFEQLSPRADVDDVGDALQSLADRAIDAARGTKSSVEAFESLGIEVQDLRGLRPDELFRLVAERVSRIENPMQRVAGAATIFGEDLARRVMPVLQQGADGLDDLASRAREMNAAFSPQETRNIVESARAMRQLRSVVDAAWAEAVAKNADEFQELGENLASIVRQSGEVVAFFNDLVDAGERLAEFSPLFDPRQSWWYDFTEDGGPSGIQELESQLERLQSREQRLKEQMEEGPRRRSVSFMQRRLRETQEEISKTKKQLRELQQQRSDDEKSDTSDGRRPERGADIGEMTQGIEGVPGIDGGDRAGRREDAEEEIQRVLDKLREQQATYGQTAEQAALYRLRTLGATEAQMEQARALSRGIEVLDATSTAEQALAQSRRERVQETRRAQQENSRLVDQMEREVELQQMTARERAAAKAVGRLNADATEEQKEQVRSLAKELYDLREASDQGAMSMEEFARSASRRVQGVFGDMLYKPWESTTEEMGRQLVNALHRAAAEALASRAMQQLTQMMGAQSGGGSGMGGAGLAVQAGMYALPMLFHEGGTVGRDGRAVGPVPAALFQGAPRLHNGGLAGDEIPAILQKGERVVPREGGQGNQQAPSVRVVNVQDPSVAEDYIRSPSGEKAILNVIRRNRGAVREQIK